MRNLLPLVVFPVVLGSYALAACGGGDDSGSTGGFSDASTTGDSASGGHDGSTSPDTGSGADAASGAETGSSDSSSSDSSSSPDTGGFACMSPAGCTSSTPVCCAHITVTGGSVPNCTTDPPVVACSSSASCPTTTGTTCSGSEIFRLCASNADCTESGNNECCTFSESGSSINFCSNAIVAAFAGATCM